MFNETWGLLRAQGSLRSHFTGDYVDGDEMRPLSMLIGILRRVYKSALAWIS